MTPPGRPRIDFPRTPGYFDSSRRPTGIHIQNGARTIAPEAREDDLLGDLHQALRRGKARLSRVGILLKEVERHAADPERYAFVLGEELRELEGASRDLQELAGIPDLLSRLAAGLSPRAEEGLQRARTAVAAALARDLGAKGLELTGNFPLLTCGVLTIEFAFEAGGKAAVWFGPKIERLRQVPIEAGAIAQAVLSSYAELEGEGFDEAGHAGTLFKAYHTTRHILGCETGKGVPITDVLLQTAILKQVRKFRTDPVRSSFTGYGRTRFAFDLSRLTTRSIDNFELHLAVASMEQTKHPETHLWVPQGPRTTKGTHFSMLAFR